MMYTNEDVMYLARTIFGEARNQPFLGMCAVAHVVLNRVEDGRWPYSIPAVVTQKWQFSCWNEDDPNRARILAMRWGTLANNAAWRQCMAAAIAVLEGAVPDPTIGSTHYHTTGVAPKWSRGHTPAVVVGDHLFFNTVE